MRRAVLRLLSLMLLVLAMLPGSAAAVTQTGATAEYCGGATVYEWGSGQMDANGLLYVPCSQPIGGGGNSRFIAVIDANGTTVNRIPIRFGDGYVRTASDVAPSPDGSFLYVMRYDDFTVYRFNRQPNGTYDVDPNWRLANFPDAGGGGSNLPRGVFIATDGNGDIYLSAGLWATGIHATDAAVVKYRPDGSYVTRFGMRSPYWKLCPGTNHYNCPQDPRIWDLGSAFSFGGVTATADGRRVFVTDINLSRVHRFDRQPDGSYRPVLTMGMTAQTDPNRWGACYQDGVLGAPYDVTLSPGGEVLVTNTTCYNNNRYAGIPNAAIEVQRYGQDGSVRGSIIAQSQGDNRIHAIAVDRGGSIHLVQGKILIRPFAGYSDAGATAGGAGPMGGTAAPADTTAPTLRSVTPAVTSTRLRTVAVSIDAVDDRGVTEMRLRVDGIQGAWQPYAANITHTLADRYGAHTLGVDVRDAAGNVSTELSITVERPAPVIGGGGGGGGAGGGGAGGGGAGDDDGGDEPVARDTRRPVIRSVRMPVQISTRSRRGMSVRVFAKDDTRVTQVRFSLLNGRWGSWQSVKGARTVRLASRQGWHGVLVQVRDAAGNRSTPWFQPVFVAPRGAQWYKGTAGADVKRFGAGTQHIDLSRFDSKVDRVSCGSGYDTVLAQPEDVVGRDCERVVRIRMPKW